MSEDRRSGDVQLGMLIKGLETLTAEVNSLRVDVAELKAKVNTGKGVFWGALFVTGGLGAGIGASLTNLSDKFFG